MKEVSGVSPIIGAKLDDKGYERRTLHPVICFDRSCKGPRYKIISVNSDIELCG